MKRPRPHLDRWRLKAARWLCPRTHCVVDWATRLADEEELTQAIHARQAMFRVLRDRQLRGSDEYRVHRPSPSSIAGPGQYDPERPL